MCDTFAGIFDMRESRGKEAGCFVVTSVFGDGNRAFGLFDATVM